MEQKHKDTDVKDLDKQWHVKYPETDPRAETLKDTFKERWVRFHSLANGKRYPETPEEQKEILSRYNAVISELNPNLLVVITCEWTHSSTPAQADIEKHAKQGEKYWMSFLEDPSETNPDLITYRHLYVNTYPWATGILDDLLIAVSNDEASGVIIAPTNLDWLYHPYDGGADVILYTTSEHDQLKSRHQEWLSRDRSGL